MDGQWKSFYPICYIIYIDIGELNTAVIEKQPVLKIHRCIKYRQRSQGRQNTYSLFKCECKMFLLDNKSATSLVKIQ